MAFIRNHLATVGTLNRAVIMKRFGVSTPQASADIKRFMELNPKAMRYNASKKQFVATKAPSGRDTTAAASSLMYADDLRLQTIVCHDPDMIRDVAAALIFERNV